MLDQLYRDWNAQINVISRQDIDNLYLHHVLHSLSIAKVVDFLSGAKVIDIGTGGGFPGIPLAIMFPQTNFVLNDSIAKKIKVAGAIAKSLGLNNVTVVNDRVENIDGQYDFVVSRAVARLDQMWQWASPKIKQESLHALPNGVFYLKGGDITAELPKNVFCKSWELKEIFAEPYFSEKALVLLSKNSAKLN